MSDGPGLRVGVAGHRRLRDPARVAREVGRHLDALLELAAERLDRGGRIRLLSPLAIGADQIAAELALTARERGLPVELVCPFPFPRPEYERDFDAEQRRRFAGLADAADRTVELDGLRAPSGGRDPARDRATRRAAYEGVGRYVVERSDLLLAVWDGEDQRRRGGTSEIVRYALDTGLPVLWIHAATPEVVRLLSSWPATSDPHHDPDWEREVRRRVRALSSPP